MDGSSEGTYFKELNVHEKELKKYSVNDSNILQPARVRRPVCFSDEVHRIFFDNRPYFLFHFNFLFLYILYLIKKN